MIDIERRSRCTSAHSARPRQPEACAVATTVAHEDDADRRLQQASQPVGAELSGVLVGVVQETRAVTRTLTEPVEHGSFSIIVGVLPTAIPVVYLDLAYIQRSGRPQHFQAGQVVLCQQILTQPKPSTF